MLEFARFRDIVEFDPPSNAPNVPVTDRDELTASEDVAVVLSVPVPPAVYTTPLDERLDKLVMF